MSENKNLLLSEYIICCDWGTSSLRCRLVDRERACVIDEITSDVGISVAYRSWRTRNSADDVEVGSRTDAYLSLLKEQLHPLVLRNASAATAPVVISGMASSNIGLFEMPYAGVPFSLSGADALTYEIAPLSDFNHRVILISGVRDGDDVMRGEEVQVIGVSGLLPTIGGNETALFLFPGTHSKHLRVENNTLVGIETFITGELFAVMSKEGLLRDAIRLPVSATGSEEGLAAFLRGVGASGHGRLLPALFKVRTNHVLGKLDKNQNTLYFSGLLIGSELRSLFTKQYDRIILACDDKLYDYYKQVISFLGLDTATSYIAPSDVNLSTVRGQLAIAKRYL